MPVVMPAILFDFRLLKRGRKPQEERGQRVGKKTWKECGEDRKHQQQRAGKNCNTRFGWLEHATVDKGRADGVSDADRSSRGTSGAPAAACQGRLKSDPVLPVEC